MCIHTHSAVCLLAAILAVFFGAERAEAQGNRVPVAEPRTEQRQQAVYRPEYVTELREVYRTVYEPVTEYHWEARWRPLQSPNWAYYPVPHVRWQARVEKTQVPHTSLHYVAETRTVQTPYLALRFAEQPAPASTTASSAPGVISLAPGGQSVATLPTQPTPAAANASESGALRLGGILRMDNDPPRRGRLEVEGTLLR